MQNTIMTVFVIHNPLSFPQPKCFRTFAVWKHFLIYPSPSRGRTCPTRNSSFSSANLPPTRPWRKSKHYACANGQTSSFVAVCTAAYSSSNTASSKPRRLCISSSAPSPPLTFSNHSLHTQ